MAPKLMLLNQALICFKMATTTRTITLAVILWLSLVQVQAEPISITSLDQSQANHQQHGAIYSPAASNLFLFKSNLVKPDAELIDLLRDGHARDPQNQNINLHYANLVWRLMRSNALEYARERVRLVRPNIEHLIGQTNISTDCSLALGGVLDHIARLDLWAFQMYNSFGDFPSTGLIEGSLASMGSYESCVDVSPNQIIGEPQYCSFSYMPILPTRPLYHNILAPIDNLANFTKSDELFNFVAKKAQYFYYTRLRIVACLPTRCSRSDLELLGKQVGQNALLQFQSLNCLTKSPGFRPDGAQIFALVILGGLAFVTFLGTLIDVFGFKGAFIRRNSVVADDLATSVRQQQDDQFIAVGAEPEESEHFVSKQKETKPSSLLKMMTKIEGIPQLNTTSIGTTTTTTTTTKSRRRPEVIRSRRNDSIMRIINVLINFSIIKNGRKLFDTTTSKKQGNVGMDSLGPGSLQTKHHQGEVEMLDAPCSSSSSSSSSTGSDVGGSAGEHENQSQRRRRQKHSANVINQETAGMGQASDISCVHGLRFWTISWIIFAHTMQYTEWAGFARAYQVEYNITNMFLHPFMNATFSVDTFFLISGLLTTYVTWSISGGSYKRFNKFAFLISRYLRLTPQVLIVILMFIIFPLLGDGPYWRGLIQKQSDYCRENWWVNALYLQSFIRSDRICNVVTWWLSIEMYFHFMSIIIIIALLKNARKGIFTAIAVGLFMTAMSCYKHYKNSYPPNMLPTILQRYEVWNSLVIEYFWSPYPHAPAYIVGLMLGYVLSTRSRIQLTQRQVKFGWWAFIVTYLTVLCGTYWWNNNYYYSRFVSTFYYNASQVSWAFATGWAILACASGNGGWLNRFLSAPIFVPLGRSTYMTYLSHMIIVMSYPAKMQLLIEPSQLVFLYIFISNLILSYILGIALTLIYESPILHLQKIIVKNITRKNLINESGSDTGNNNNNATSNNNTRNLIIDHSSATHMIINSSDKPIIGADGDEVDQNCNKKQKEQLLARSDPC